jgi:L-glutamine-phosphate cytidylyltransferase
MKAIILAAGKGSRMDSKTENKPKCMIQYNEKEIINYILDSLTEAGIDDIIIVDGYKNYILEEHLKKSNIKFITNKNYSSTNMVYSLFCAESEMNDDIIVSYSDIIYNKKTLNKLINNKSEFSVAVDKKWLELWKLRMEDPLSDAETMKIDEYGNIIELGKKPKSYKEIQGQYIGLFKIKNRRLKEIRNFYHGLNKTDIYDGNNYNNMYMTTFIQLIIDKLLPIRAEIIEGGWLEFDTVNDINSYNLNKVFL